MKKLSLKDLLLAEYFIVLAQESGLDFKQILKVFEGKKGKEADLIRFLLERKKSLFLMAKPVKDALIQFQLLHDLVSQNGGTLASVLKTTLKNEAHDGYCKKSASRGAFRALSLGIGTGLPLETALLAYLREMEGEQPFTKKTESLLLLKNRLNEKSLDGAFLYLTELQKIGADLREFLVFLAGDAKI